MRPRRPFVQPRVEHLDQRQPGEVELPADAGEREAAIDELARAELLPVKHVDSLSMRCQCRACRAYRELVSQPLLPRRHTN